jgi:TRAP-type uncharacterized transport system fused permease subunit
LTATAGCLLLAAGLHGYLLTRATLLERALLVGAAVALIQPGWLTDTIGAALVAVVVGLQLAARRRAQAEVAAD